MEYIKIEFDRLYNEPFPSERGKEISGIDLVLIDSDTMGLASRFIGSKGHLTANEIILLESCLADLNKIVPELNKNERQYFASLRHIAIDILEITKGKKVSDIDVEKRQQCK